jgi:hypothetical protein
MTDTTITGYNTNNGNYSSTSTDIDKVIPQSEIHYKQIFSDDEYKIGSFTLQNNYTNTTNYAVFPSIYYGYTGSSGTYDSRATSSAVGPIIIYDITSTGFSWALTKTTGQNVDIYLVFLVIYNLDNLDYSKT